MVKRLVTACQEWATSIRSCHGVFADQFIFENGFGANFDYLLNSTNRSAKPTDLTNALIDMVEILFSREKVL